VIYRDRPVRCPRCLLDIARDEARERWRCERCAGLLLSVAEVAKELVEVAPDLVPEGGVFGLATIGRRSAEPPLWCGVCAGAMEPVFLGGVEIDRCCHDQLIWFDPSELSRVRDVAGEQSERRRRARAPGWLSRLLG
jgi:Zn-finger nucleic acid-binding protein